MSLASRLMRLDACKKPSCVQSTRKYLQIDICKRESAFSQSPYRSYRSRNFEDSRIPCQDYPVRRHTWGGPSRWGNIPPPSLRGGEAERAVSSWIYMAALICSVGNFNGAIAHEREKRRIGREEQKGTVERGRRKGGKHLEGSPNSSMINTFVYVHVTR